jgi:hypothetical protein
MRIFWISTEGLKSLRSRELTELKDLSTYNVLIGPNNAGKSTLLESIQLVRAVVSQIPVEGIYSRDPPTDRIAFEVGLQLSPDEIRALASKAGVGEVPQEHLDSLSCWSFLLNMRSGAPQWPEGHAALRQWWLVRDNECYEIGAVEHDEAWDSRFYSSVPELILNVSSQPLVPIRDVVSILKKNWTATARRSPLSPQGNELGPFGEMIQQFANKIHRLDSLRSPREHHRLESVGKEDTLNSNAENLVAFLHVYFSRKPYARYEFNRAFHNILPELHGFLDPVDEYDVKLKMAPKLDANAEESYDIRNVGGAARQVLCIMAFVWTAEPGDILLIEEPELNLHPSAQRKLSAFLLGQAKDRDLQIVLSTHSTIFARRGADCRTYLVTLDPQRGTVTRLLQEQELGASCAVLGMRQAYVFGYDVCVLFQGESEEQALPLLIEAVASANHVDPDDLGIWPVNLEGGPPRKAVEPYLKYIHRSSVIPYVLLDDDQGVRDFVRGLVKQGLVSEKHCHIWEGRTRQGRSKSVGSEFEDNFTDEQLISAANQLAEMEYAEGEIPGQLSVETFRARMKESTVKTSHELEKYYIQVFGTRGWSKPALNEMLARQLAEEIKQGNEPEHARELIEVCKEIINTAQRASSVGPRDSEP